MFIQNSHKDNENEKYLKDLIKAAKATGVNPSHIINEIQHAFEGNTPQTTTNRILTDADVDQTRRSFIQSIQQILEKYGVSDSWVASCPHCRTSIMVNKKGKVKKLE